MRTFLRISLGVLALLAAAVALIAAEPAAGAPLSTPAPADSAPAFPLIAILNYHHLADDVRNERWDTVSPAFLREQIRASKAAGWTFLSLGELLAARERPETLPPRVLVLTFDDGYRSFHELALPVLREEQVPATLAIITAFVDHPPADLPPLMSWDEIRQAATSGWVEIASHTHDLHRYETSNPWRDTAPSVTTRRYRLAESRYEDRDEYRARLRADLERSQSRIEERLGRRARVLAWPYGEHNAMARTLAADAGFEATLSLGARAVTAADLAAGCLPRILVSRGMAIGSSDPKAAWILEPRGAIRAAQVDLDAVWDPDTAAFRRRVDETIATIRRLGATHVFLQACPDPNGDGRHVETWFMNHQAPVRADIWSMVAAKLSHAKLEIWLRAPSMNLPWEWERHPEWRMPFEPGPADRGKTPWYFRISPDLPEARQAAIDFFVDAAVYLPIHGVLFDDDAYALAGERLRGSRVATAAGKDQAIRTLHREIMDAVRAWRPDCQFARNVYAPVVERAGAHPEFAQDFDRALSTYDLTVVMAYPHMEGHARDAARWTAALAKRAARRWSAVARASGAPLAPVPVMFKLQAYDWSEERWVPSTQLSALAAEARRAGIVHLGVYPVIAGEGDLPERLLEAAIGAPELRVTSGDGR